MISPGIPDQTCIAPAQLDILNYFNVFSGDNLQVSQWFHFGRIHSIWSTDSLNHRPSHTMQAHNPTILSHIRNKQATNRYWTRCSSGKFSGQWLPCDCKQWIRQVHVSKTYRLISGIYMLNPHTDCLVLESFFDNIIMMALFMQHYRVCRASC